MAKEARINRKIAENLAIQALWFLAADPERLGAFLAATGIGPEMIRKAAAEPVIPRRRARPHLRRRGLLIAVAEHAGADARRMWNTRRRS